MKNTKALTLILATAAAFALAGSSKAQTDLNILASRNEDKADAAMNIAYRKLMAVLTPPQQTQLVRTQRAWLAFRDADAALLSSASEGISIHPMVRARHLQEITEQRTRELRKSYGQFTIPLEM